MLHVVSIGLLVAIAVTLAHWVLLPLFVGFHNSLTLLLPLVMPMGLLVIIPTTLAHWVLLPLFLGFHNPFTLFLPFSSFFARGPFFFFLLLGSLSKKGINIQPPEHVDYFCNSHVSTFVVFLCGLF